MTALHEAIREAEREMALPETWDEVYRPTRVTIRSSALRALLAAAKPPAPADPQTIIDTIRWVLNDAHYKAPEQIAGYWREVWAPKLRTAVDAMPVGSLAEPAPALPDAVAEAAKRLNGTLRRREAKSWCGCKDCDYVRSEAWALLSALAAAKAPAPAAPGSGGEKTNG